MNSRTCCSRSSRSSLSPAGRAIPKTMRRKVRIPRSLIDSAERILIFVQRDFRVDHQRLPARHPNDDVGAEPAALAVFHADLGGEVAMLRQTTGLKHVTKLLLTPAASRFRSVPQGIHELCGFGRNAFRPRSHRIDLARKQTESVAAFRFHLGNGILIALQALMSTSSAILRRTAYARA